MDTKNYDALYEIRNKNRIKNYLISWAILKSTKYIILFFIKSTLLGSGRYIFKMTTQEYIIWTIKNKYRTKDLY